MLKRLYNCLGRRQLDLCQYILVFVREVLWVILLCVFSVLYKFFHSILLVWGKRGELRYGNILPAPKPSSLCRVLKYLSSRVLLFKKLITYSYILFRVSIDPRVKPEGDRKERVPEGDERRKSVPEGDNLYKVMPRFGTNRQTIFELGRNKIGRFLEFFATQKIGMTVLMVVFSLFLLFPNVSNSAVYFLPDAQWDAPINVSIDSSRCEDIGYTYYSSGTCPANHNQDTCVFNSNYLKCDATGWCLDNGYTLSSCTSPKTLSTPCPSNASLYKSCVCPSTYKYACTGTGYTSGSGTACNSKYTSCTCATNYTWSGSACVCKSSFKYACSGTGYSSGSGAACGGKYESCSCANLYDWTGSACVHTHSYTCPSGYTTSSTGMIDPISADKTCACGAKSGTCYKEGHSHSYSCTSGYSASCSNGYSSTASKKCSCGATSGTCYACCASTYKYSCSGTGYSSGSGTACSGKYTSCNCSTQYKWSGSACSYCGDSYKYACSVSGNITGGSGTACGSRYTACTCKSPFTWSSGSCVCPSTYKYACSGTGYSSGSGTACSGKYTSCNCATNYTWNGSACVCDSSFKYACSGTGEAGSGTSCGGKYKLCVCTTNYVAFCNVTFCS